MHDDKFLDEYFQICKRIYEQMERDGTWPWAETDSPKSEDLVESGDNLENV